MWGRLIVLLLPVAVLGVWLKLLRIRSFYPEAGLADVAVKVASDVAFGVSWMLLWVLACLVTKGRARQVVFVLAQIATCVVGLLSVLNHEYMIRTGNPLTAEQIVTAVQQRGELNGLLQSQLTLSAQALIVTVLVGTLVAPWALGGLVARALRWRPTIRAKRVSAVACAGLLLASAWTAPTASAAFSLAPPVQLAITPVREALAYPEVSDEDVATPNPGATSLQPRSEQRRNVVIITLESQRATSTLPETRQPVTPVLDALAETSIVPERGYTVLPHTSKALTAIHCGVVPPLDSENSEADQGSLPAKCLPGLLAEQGYQTAFFQSATETFERRRGTVSNLGFGFFKPVDQMNSAGFSTANYFGYEDSIMLAPQRAWLQENAGEPFLLSMLTVSAHHDYNLPGIEQIDFVDDEVMNKYLNGLHYQDQFVGKVIDMFKDLGLYDNTVFVVSGDHGEGFGEHRIYQHDNTIYEEGIRIPILIHDPQRSGQLIDGPVNQLAIFPTVVDALGFDVVSEEQYRPSLLSGQPQGPVMVTCYARARCSATLEGDTKVIHHFGDRRDEVYDLSVDPYELQDLAADTDSAWIAQQADLATSWYSLTERRYVLYREQ